MTDYTREIRGILEEEYSVFHRDNPRHKEATQALHALMVRAKREELERVVNAWLDGSGFDWESDKYIPPYKGLFPLFYVRARLHELEGGENE